MYICQILHVHLDSSIYINVFIQYRSYCLKLNTKHKAPTKSVFCSHGIVFFTLFILSCIVLQPNITDITIIPGPNSDSQLLHQLNETVSLTCTAEGGPRIMTRWQFDNGSSVITVASGSSSVTYNITSLSTEHAGVYYCEAIIDGMTDTSMEYALFGQYVF